MKKLWRLTPTGFVYERDVSDDLADQWLAVYRKDKPWETYTVAEKLKGTAK